MNPFDWFEHVYCINAIPERREAMEQRLAGYGFHTRHGGRLTFTSALTPSSDFNVTNMRRNPRIEFAVGLSHMQAICHAVRNRRRKVLFLEDDVVFDEAAEHRLRIGIPEIETHARRDKPHAWEVIYLGGHPCEDVERIGEHAVKVGRFSFAEAYCLQFPEFFVPRWLDRIGQPNAMFDRILGEYARDSRSYCIYPIVTKQESLVSSIAGQVDDKTHCLESGWSNHLAV